VHSYILSLVLKSIAIIVKRIILHWVCLNVDMVDPVITATRFLFLGGCGGGESSFVHG